MFSTFQLYNRFFLIYLLLFLFFLFCYYESFPSWYDASEQMFIFIIGIFTGISIIRENGKNIFFKVFLFQLFGILSKIFVNVTFYGDFIGPNAIDAIDYREYGEKFGNIDFLNYFHILEEFEDFDDWGFLVVIWFCYHFLGSFGYWGLLLFNMLVSAFTAFRLYRLSNFFVNKKLSILIAAIWGVMPFAIETASGFLKENFFSLVVVQTFYYVYHYIKYKKNKYIIYALFWGIAISFFRMALGGAILLSLLSIFLINNPFFKKHLFSIAILLIVPLFTIAPFVISFLLAQRGLSMEALVDPKTDGTIGFIIDYLTGLFGPFPKFIGDNESVQYMTFSSFSALVKTLVSPFFWIELFLIFYKGKTQFLPVVVFVLCNLLMLIIGHFAIQLRFQWPHMSIFLIIAAMGFFDTIKYKKIKIMYMIYLLSVLIIIYKYNVGI